MTGWRGSIGWKLEDRFGFESGTAGQGFEYIGPGMDFTFTPDNQMKYTYTTGSKFYDTVTAGRFKGAFRGSVLLDYNHFKWLLAVFEDYHYDITNNQHVFAKSNTKKLKSFSMKAIQLNRAVGGSKDQQIIYKGCVITSFQPSYESASTATIPCTISGVYVDEYQVLQDLEETEFDAMEPNTPAKYPVEWGCLQVPDGTPLANNERTGFTLNSSVSTIPTCGSRFDSDFYEGQLGVISVTSRVYSRNPETWYLRLYTGGEDPTIDDSSSFQYGPKSKNLRPLDSVSIVSTSADSNYSCKVLFENVTVESMSKALKSGSEIVDEPTLKARKATMYLKTPEITANLLSANLTGGTPGVGRVLQDYTIQYALDSGSADPALSSFSGCDGDTFVLPTASQVTKEGYTLTSWSDGTRAYQPGATATVNSNAVASGTTTITFTAVWTASTQ